MRFLYSLAFLAGVHAGGDDTTTTTVSADTSATVATTAAAPELTDRLFTMPATTYATTTYAATSYAPAYPTYSGSCSYYYDCWSCLGNSACLWDPNTGSFGGGTCKPATQCDFTYQPRTLALSASVAAAPPATACVRSVSQCSQSNFNGAILNPNPRRGVGCTNHGQCGSGQYCYSCAKCVGSCGACNSGVPASGMCGPAYRCPIDNDSISNSCPGSSIYPPVPVYPGSSCSSYYSCSPCTAAYGCIWSGSTCYYSTVPCSGYGCANTPSQCAAVPTFPTYPTYPGGSCSNYYTCSSCAAAYGCIWSGSTCYYSTVPCSGYGCANTPDQCYGGGVIPTYPIYPTYPTYPTYPGSSCSSYYSCSPCTAAYGCIWSGSSCYYSTVPCSGYGCANTPSQCSSTPWNWYGSSSYVPSYSSLYRDSH